MMPKALVEEALANERLLDRYRAEGWTVIDPPRLRGCLGELTNVAVLERKGVKRGLVLHGETSMGLFPLRNLGL